MRLEYEKAQNLLLDLEAADDWMHTIPPNRGDRCFLALVLQDRGLVEHMGEWRFRMTDAGHQLCEELRAQE